MHCWFLVCCSHQSSTVQLAMPWQCSAQPRVQQLKMHYKAITLHHRFITRTGGGEEFWWSYAVTAFKLEIGPDITHRVNSVETDDTGDR